MSAERGSTAVFDVGARDGAELDLPGFPPSLALPHKGGGDLSFFSAT